MDHRAIVWCHNVLEKVRNILHLMVVVENNDVSKEQLQRLLQTSDDDYSKVVTAQKETFQVSYFCCLLSAVCCLLSAFIW